MRYINRLFTYLLTAYAISDVRSNHVSVPEILLPLTLL